MATKIPWCDETLNLVTGCTKVSPGCKNCYAEGFISRFGHKRDGSENDKKFSRIVLHQDRLETPYKWKRPKSILVPSMGDLFHENVPSFVLTQVFDMIRELQRHTFLLLTKRPENVLKYMHYVSSWFPPNAWIGVSVEDQETADKRIPELLNIPSNMRFVSVEPILEKIDLTTWLGISEGSPGLFARDTGSYLDWVIAGCESGNKRRLAKIDWFRSLRDQCVVAKVPFFLKQAEGYNDGKFVVVEMPVLDGRIWNQKPT